MGLGLKKLFAMLTGEGQAAVNAASAVLEARNPEIAIGVDRQEMEANYRMISTQLAVAKEKLKAEEADVVNVQAQINKDLAIAETLIAQGKEDKANVVMAEVETLQKKMEKEKRERDAALQIVHNFEEAHAKLKQALEAFDGKAKEALQELDEAKSQKQSAAAIRQSEAIVSNTTKIGSDYTSSLANLHKAAAGLRANAEVDRDMTNLDKSVVEKDSDIAAAAALVEANAKGNETAKERLERLRGK